LQVIYKTRNQLTHEKSGAHWQVPQSETKGESIIMFTPMNMCNGLMRTKSCWKRGQALILTLLDVSATLLYFGVVAL